MSLLGREGASPLGLAATVLADNDGLVQVLFMPASPEHDWHFNVENLVEGERRAAELASLGGLSSSFAYDRVLPPRLEPGASEKVGVDVAFYAVLVRYATWSRRDVRRFCQGMRVATGILRFGNRAWRVLSHEDLVGALDEERVDRMVRERKAYRPGLMLTSREVASLVHTPNARTLAMLSCIAQRHGAPWMRLRAGGGVARLGVNRYAGTSRPVEIPLGVRLRHMYVLGTTGSGKSTLLAHLAVEDTREGFGLCLVDPHGDLALEVLARLPRSRLDDLVYVAFDVPGRVPVWNPFQTSVPPGKLADDLAGAFLAQSTSWGARMEHNIRMLAYTVAELGGTLEDFAELAARSDRGEELRQRALDTIANPQVHRFLRSELPGYSQGELGSVRNKLSRLLLDDTLQSMLSQPDNHHDPREWMDEGRIVLINLSSVRIGADHARFVGSLIYRAALTRTRDRRPFLLYLDEFQQLQTATLTGILSEGRKYGLASILAHQERGQLAPDLKHALGNAATHVYFRPADDDIPRVHRALANHTTTDDLRNLDVGEAYVRVGSRIANLQTQPLPPEHERDPCAFAREYAARHYQPITRAQRVGRRPRVYDTFEPIDGENAP